MRVASHCVAPTFADLDGEHQEVTKMRSRCSLGEGQNDEVTCVEMRLRSLEEVVDCGSSKEQTSAVKVR